MPKQDKFTCYINFWRYDKSGKRVGWPRKEKLRLEVVDLKVETGIGTKTKATLFFEDGTHVGPFNYSKWYPDSRKAVIASNYEKFRYSRSKEGGQGDA